MLRNRETMVEQMLASDATADGKFIVGVRTTKIYCLPSCRPPRKPKPENVTFFETIAEARAAGLRACKLCKPDNFYLSHGIEQLPAQAAKIAYLDTVLEAPGPLAFAVDRAGALLWLKFLDGHYDRSLEAELTGAGYQLTQDSARTAQAHREISEYCAGNRQEFTLPLALHGTPWQQTVWQALTAIPFGETRTYGQLAHALGRPTAARAVGSANAANKIPLVIPCHRVVGADYSLTGFAGGIHIKKRLLAHEARVKSENS